MAAGWAKGSSGPYCPWATHRTKHHSPSPRSSRLLLSALQRRNSREGGTLDYVALCLLCTWITRTLGFWEVGHFEGRCLEVKPGDCLPHEGHRRPPGRGGVRERWDSGKCITDHVKGLQVCLRPPTPALLLFPLAVEFLSQTLQSNRETARQSMLGKTGVVAHRQEDRANGPAGPTSPETGAMDSGKGWGPQAPTAHFPSPTPLWLCS